MSLTSEHIGIIKEFFLNSIIDVNTKNPVTLASGLKSPIYFDHRKIFSLPKLRNQVLSLWAHQLKEILDRHIAQNTNLEKSNFEDSFFVAGTATAGIAPGFGLAQMLNLPFVYVRSEPKKHGLGNAIEGVLPKQNQKAIVIDDMVTTGGSVLKVVEILKQNKFSIALTSCISRHENPKTERTFANLGLTLHSLFLSSQFFREEFKFNKF